MIKKITTIALFTLSINSFAYQVNFDNYDKDCLKYYFQTIDKIGATDLKGAYLIYNQDEKISDRFQTLYFNPDFSFDVSFSDSTKQRTHDFTKTGNTYVFYTKKANKDGARSGYEYVIKDISNDEYLLRINKMTRIVFLEHNYEKPLFEEVVYFDEGRKIDAIKFKREKTKEESLFWEKTEINARCLK